MITNPIISFCIPTFNRVDWCCEALLSILNQNPTEEVEICVSINFSDSSYSSLINLVNSSNYANIIKLFEHKNEISLDENHHFVVNMANGTFVYLLGDDDILLPGSIYDLISLIKKSNPDLVVLNGNKINKDSKVIGQHFFLDSKEYLDAKDAFNDLRDKCTFGAVLTRKVFFKDNLFRTFYGTKHAYGIFWLSLFEKEVLFDCVKVIVPNFKCVSLRFAEKSYNSLEVNYKSIPLWFDLFAKFLPNKSYAAVVSEYRSFNMNITASIFFLENELKKGYNLKIIKEINEPLYFKLRYRIMMAYVLNGLRTSLLFPIFRSIIQSIKSLFYKKINLTP
jgi:abequosyltransferase